MAEREKRTEITADNVIQEYAKIAFADIRNFLSFRTVLVKVNETDDGESVYKYRQTVETKPSDYVDITMISEVSISGKGTLSSNYMIRNLDALGRHL